MTQKQRMDKEEQHRVLVRDLNPMITCRLCEGYFVDATTLVDCLHVFCRACILRHFENSKTGCPTCNTMYKKKSQTCFRPDTQIQTLVYKLVPALYAKEMQRREDFYRSTGVRASSSCSDDSVIDRERDMINDQEEMISSYVGDKTQFFGPEDSISLSLEYYQAHLDHSDDEEKSKQKPGDSDATPTNSDQIKAEQLDLTNVNSDSDSAKDKEQADNSKSEGDRDVKECDKRFLQCPPAVSMKHLQKFIRMKFGLTGDHRVDIIYKGEVLPVNFSLMDVAYTFKWKRVKPMRFFYRIFTPMKVRPIKIVNTTLSTGGRQLQIVPVKPSADLSAKPAEELKPEPELEKPRDKDLEESEDQKNDKERLFAHLQLQSKSQVEKDKKVPEKPLIKDCVFEYEEPDQEEIKRFAEKRDREWALQKKLDDETRKDEVYVSHHFSKKRKKSKHSKNEFNLHKKRKLHAEIASNEEELKLKVKITNNGHKHKHHKSSGQVNEKTQTSDVSSKEKLLQMRQVRHKHVPSEDKNVQTVPSIKLSKDSSTSTEKSRADPVDKPTVEERQTEVKEAPEEPRKSPKLKEDIAKLKIKVTEPSSSVSESAVLPKQQNQGVSTSPKIGTFLEPTSSKPGFVINNSVEKGWSKKVPTVQLERNEQTEKQAQKTFLKTFQSYTEKYQRNEKLQQSKLENVKAKLNSAINKDKLIQIKAENNKITNNKSLERKIANLQQHCTIEAKPQEKIEKKMPLVNDKPKMVTPHYPAGFTVSKIEQGVKRKADDSDSVQDTRPSLEITLINPPTSSPVQQSSKPVEKPPVKRPPPATIPLDRIKKSVNLKSGISIIPKLPERCDNIGALDLSKTSKSPDSSPKISPKVDIPNGFNLVSRQLNALSRAPTTAGSEKNNMALSNLQMLSKVATEHSSLNNKTPQQNNLTLNKPRPQMPSLQTLKVPSLQNPGQMKTPNLQKMPKLNEIHKFRPTNPQIRNLRPNQNQNIRNIPNPSLLIRQQNQNRLSQMATMQQSSSGEAAKTTLSVSTPSPAQKEAATTVTPVKTAIESKLQEKKEISV